MCNKRRTDKLCHCFASWVLAWGSSGTVRGTVPFLFFECCCWHLKQRQISLEMQPLGAFTKFLECCFRTVFKYLNWPGQHMGSSYSSSQESFLHELCCQAAWAEPSSSCSESLLPPCLLRASLGWLLSFVCLSLSVPPRGFWVPNDQAVAAEILYSDAALWVCTCQSCPVGFNCSSSSVCYVPLECISAFFIVVLLFSCWFWCFWFLCLHWL